MNDALSSYDSAESRLESILETWQKRQATLLNHFSSMDYLLGLQKMVDDFVNGVDITLDTAQRQGRDRFLVSERWGVRNTVANFSTYGFPALKDFQKWTSRQIVDRTNDIYSVTDYYNCWRTLNELSMYWSTPEEEAKFEAAMRVIGDYSGRVDTLARHGWEDGMFDRYWDRYGVHYPRLPKFHVRKDIEAVTGELPPRTGIYIPQNDPAACLEFAWTGSDEGRLPESFTFNELGLQAIAVVGREALWKNDPRLLVLARQPRYIKAFMARRYPEIDEEDYVNDPRKARSFISNFGTESRPCKWYFVEHIEGEWEEAEPEAAPVDRRLRGESGEHVPATGWWHTVAISSNDAYRRFEQGARFPDTRYGDRGQIIWNYDPDQQPESERIRIARELENEVSAIVFRLETPRPGAATKPGETAGEHIAPSAPADPPANVPAGLRIPSGGLCTKSGYWESDDTNGVKRVRVQMIAGDSMPLVKLARKLTLWERLDNDPLLINGKPTTWTFVEALS